MLDVLCPHCAKTAQISPYATHCNFCNADLHAELSTEDISSFFYSRASDFFAAGDRPGALREAKRGLERTDSSELRLLAAILSERSGAYDEMRSHVAAIPIDDALRPEAEWLLRSHQDRQRDHRQISRDTGARGAVTSELLPASLQRLYGGQPGAVTPMDEVRRRGRAIALGVIAVALLFVVALSLTGRTAEFAGLFGGDRGTDAAQIEAAETTGANLSATDPVDGEGVDAVGTEQDGAQQEPGSDEGEGEPTPAPTETVSPNLVLDPTDMPLLTDSQPELPAATTLDVPAVLARAGLEYLIEVGIKAEYADGSAILKGVVPQDAYRQAIIEAFTTVDGVQEVNSVQLYVRPPATYRVVAGDTLWGISARFYGADRMDDIYALNQELITPSGGVLVDTEIRLPPLEQDLP